MLSLGFKSTTSRSHKNLDSCLTAITLFPMWGGGGVSQLIQTTNFQTRIAMHGWKLNDNKI